MFHSRAQAEKHHNKTMNIALILILIVNLVLISAEDDGPVVHTTNGLLRGMNLQTKTGKKYQAFVGVRYAQPPVGNLRFKPPAPMDYWDGIKDATTDHNMCIQINTLFSLDIVEGVEDCLFLNVYTPRTNTSIHLPVMVFFHGGSYHCGTGSRGLYRPDTLVQKDVILVTLNYRLGALGFFSTGDIVVPGNNGLKDQNFALQWVKRNIRKFGGNPKSVTIFGESSGASSAHLHMFSPLSKGLFHGAISESASALVSWTLKSMTRGVTLSKRLAGLLNCPVTHSSEMVECLRNVDAKDIVKKVLSFLEFDIEPAVLFSPVIEPFHHGAFISDTPENIAKNGMCSDVPWIVGTNSGEGALRSAPIMSTPGLLKKFNEEFSELGHVVLFMDKTENTVAATKKILNYYFGGREVDATNRQSLTDMYTDAYFSVSVDKAVSLHTKYNTQPVYNYLFDYRGSMSYTGLLGAGETDFGVCHGDDLFYLFPMNEVLFPGKQPTVTDLKMAELLSTLWTNFAKHKKPTLTGVPTRWRPVESKANEYLHIKQDQSLSMERYMFRDRMEFWKTLKYYLLRAF